ncbi:MAG: P-loop NTPase, partial [Anaerolineae bacterium]|nr:P-loop NTPase [Anaerolineae bacterium]
MQDELTMDLDLRIYWQLIRHWLWLIVLAALLAGGTAYTVSKWMVEPVYNAAVRIIVQPSSSLMGSDYADIMAGQRAAQTYAEMINSRPLQEAALLRLGYPAGQIIPYELTIAPVRDTQVLKISVESTDAQLTADLANMLAQVFMEENQERQTARFQDALARLQKQIDSLEQDIGDYRARLDATSDSTERSELESQITRLQDSLSRLYTAYQSIQLAELQAADLVSVIEPARYPQGPIRPRKMMNALLAAVVGGMIAVGGVFLQEYLDTSIKSSDEAERLVEAPVLGRIWHESEKNRVNGSGEQGVIIDRPLSLGAEAYRLLRTNLQFTSVDEPLKVILVTSPSPGEGKSTVALNLALALEATGKRVILIDADMRRSKLCKYAQVEREPGLSETLVSPEMDLWHYLQPVPMQPEIQILPPGHNPPN